MNRITFDPADHRTQTTPPTKKAAGKRVVLTTFGSFGDLHPYLAIALGLQARGHHAVLATSPVYQQKIENEGIGFYPVRPDLPSLDDREVAGRVMNPQTGTEYIVRHLLMPHLRASYDDLTQAVQQADLLVSHPITYAAPLVAQTQGIFWASSVLQPMVFVSAYDPPVPPSTPALARLRVLGPTLLRPIMEVGKRGALPWVAPIARLRAEIGLPPDPSPIFDGHHSPHLVLALFSPILGAPQPDWPPQTRATGFPFYDRRDKEEGLPPDLDRFLEAGPPPLVFTLGTSAVLSAGDFYEHSVEAARRLDRRAVLLVGKNQARNLPPGRALPPGVVAFAYAPHSELFPRAAAIIHQGGIGTTGQALRAGRPQLVVPFAHDQPDNADRVVRLGVGRTVSRRGYTATRAVKELRRLLDDPRYAAKTADVGAIVRAEDGVGAACEAIEERLQTRATK